MSLAIVHSRAQTGVQAPAVSVEVHLANGLPALTLVGLPEAALRCCILKLDYRPLR
ncbi:AAA+ ATPase superfamily protein YifB/ComM [Pseudomonas chlororaphis subsp. aureofaciens]|nr:AAA+ ATPase superfamily protein YifB/ComM [Pseudomonas chlororaphis subsp. aureofaciens]